MHYLLLQIKLRGDHDTYIYIYVYIYIYIYIYHLYMMEVLLTIAEVRKECQRSNGNLFYTKRDQASFQPKRRIFCLSHRGISAIDQEVEEDYNRLSISCCYEARTTCRRAAPWEEEGVEDGVGREKSGGPIEMPVGLLNLFFGH